MLLALQAKFLRMSNDADSAIRIMQTDLASEGPRSFKQADGLIFFELAWTLLSQRRYEQAAEMFIKVMEVNKWFVSCANTYYILTSVGRSHGTYYFLVAGCYTKVGLLDKAQKLYDSIPALIEKRKIAGKEHPMEVLIKKKHDLSYMSLSLKKESYWFSL